MERSIVATGTRYRPRIDEWVAGFPHYVRHALAEGHIRDLKEIMEKQLSIDRSARFVMMNIAALHDRIDIFKEVLDPDDKEMVEVATMSACCGQNDEVFDWLYAKYWRTNGATKEEFRSRVRSLWLGSRDEVPFLCREPGCSEERVCPIFVAAQKDVTPYLGLCEGNEKKIYRVAVTMGAEDERLLYWLAERLKSTPAMLFRDLVYTGKSALLVKAIEHYGAGFEPKLFEDAVREGRTAAVRALCDTKGHDLLARPYYYLVLARRNERYECERFLREYLRIVGALGL